MIEKSIEEYFVKKPVYIKYPDESIAYVQSNNTSRGLYALDQLLKAAPVNLIEAFAICPGIYIILFSGKTADVETSYNVAVHELGDDYLNDAIIIRDAHPKLFYALRGNAPFERFEAFGCVEYWVTAHGLLGADIAVKAADVSLLEVRLAKGIAGRSYFTLCGSVGMVRRAVNAAIENVKNNGRIPADRILYKYSIIEGIHEDLKKFLL